jgi:hypothetical protein
MKRAIQILAAAVIAFGVSSVMVGCSDPQGTLIPSGKWVITEVDGVAAVSENNWMNFKDDGTLVQSAASRQSQGIWVLSGSDLTITTLADPNDQDDFDMTLPYTIVSINGNRMVMKFGNAEMVMERQ